MPLPGHDLFADVFGALHRQRQTDWTVQHLAKVLGQFLGSHEPDPTRVAVADDSDVPVGMTAQESRQPKVLGTAAKRGGAANGQDTNGVECCRVARPFDEVVTVHGII